MKICLVAHTENFKENKEKYKWLVQEFENLARKIKTKIPVNWMLEEDETKPFGFEIRAGNHGAVITEGSDFFKILKKKGHELGIHIHFVKGRKVDFSYSNQERLIKNAKNKFISAFGSKPKSFVGGWWHSDQHTIHILENEGFLVDASPMPLYAEIRRKWLFGKIPSFSKIKMCDWSNYYKRRPFFYGKILHVANAVDPKINRFSIKRSVSLDFLDSQMKESLEVFKNFKNRKIDFLCIPFHPHYLTRKKFSKICEFFVECNKIEKIHFLRLQDVYKTYKKDQTSLGVHLKQNV